MYKKVLIVAALSLMITVACFSQAADELTPAQAETIRSITQLNASVIDAYKAKQYDTAIRDGEQARALIEKNALSENRSALVVLTNLAEAYLATGKETAAVDLFQKVLDVYQRQLGEADPSVVKLIDRLATGYTLGGDHKKAEEYYLKSIALTEKAKGAESREVAQKYNALGTGYWRANKFEEANNAFQRAILINDKVFTDQEKPDRADVNDYHCFVQRWRMKQGKPDTGQKEIADFFEMRRKASADYGKGVVSSGVINGKAKHLAKPQSLGMLRRSSGLVMVHVKIDEQGKVYEAKGNCGPADLVKVSEEAAMRSEFSPTLLEGKPVKVSGMIVYNFQ